MALPACDPERGTYRCLGCRRYLRRPEYRRVGLGAVCSRECLQVAIRASRANPRTRRVTGEASGRPGRVALDIPHATRSLVARRDRGRCRYCGTRTGLHQHHISYRSQGGDHQPHNLITLCYRHHDLVHADKGRYQRLLRAIVWLDYLGGPHLTVPQVEAFVTLT